MIEKKLSNDCGTVVSNIVLQSIGIKNSFMQNIVQLNKYPSRNERKRIANLHFYDM